MTRFRSMAILPVLGMLASQPAHADFIKFVDTATGIPTKLMNFGSGMISLMNGTATVNFQNKTGKPILDFEFSWVGDENNYTRNGGPFFKYVLFNKTSADFYKQDKEKNPTVMGTGIPINQLFQVQIQFSKDIAAVTYEPTEAAFPKPAPEPPGFASLVVALAGLGAILKCRNGSRRLR